MSLGVPAFELGDVRGCYEVYACTSRLLLSILAVPVAVRDRLRKALERAATGPEGQSPVSILQHAFNTILGGTPVSMPSSNGATEGAN